MRFICWLFAGSVLVTLASAQTPASGVKVIANSGMKTDSISPREIKRVYLLEASSLDDGTHVEPVLRRGGHSHEAFLKEFIDRNDDDLRSYYGAIVFTGKGSMPKELGSDAEMVKYVARTRGAIGCVSEDASTDGVKILEVVDAARAGLRKLIRQVEPEYPETLRKLGIGGIVRLEVTISPKGNVETVQLLGGNPILADAAIAAVKQWTYSSTHSRSTSEVSIPFDPQH